MGFGGSDKPYRGIRKYIYKLLQKPFREKGKVFPNFNILDDIAKKVTSSQNRAYDLDVLRQVITLSMLFEKIGHETNNTLIIGDGFGTMASLVHLSKFSSKIILINLTKTLLVDLSYLKKNLGEFNFEKKVALITSSSKTNSILFETMQNNEIEIVAIEAKNQDLIKQISIDIAINIASMQEMNPDVSNKYVNDMRLCKTTTGKPLFFYCCNRVEKHLPGGEITKIQEYGWEADDEVVLDELCQWHQKYYSIIPPFYRNYDGPHWHKLIRLNKHNE
jgi:hypothetical protein